MTTKCSPGDPGRAAPAGWGSFGVFLGAVLLAAGALAAALYLCLSFVEELV
jgi:hypothetical protein